VVITKREAAIRMSEPVAFSAAAGAPEPGTTQRRVLDLLQNAADPLTVEAIVRGSGLHANTVRAHLALLGEMGLVESVPEPRRRPGRPRLLYRAVPHGEPTDPYRALAAELAAASTEPGTTPGEAAGRRLARTQRDKQVGEGAPVDPETAVAMAVEGLDVLGFHTTTDPLGDRLYLAQCPFADLARQDRAICRLHREMLGGFFGELDAGVGVRRLDIFVKDDLCVVHLDRPDLRPAPSPQPAQAAPRPWEQ
jgi:predicted ArsR family transcriptional regulator